MATGFDLGVPNQGTTPGINGGKRSEEQALADLTREMVERAKELTDAFSDLWEDGIRYIFNAQLTGKKREKGWPASQINFLYPAIVQELAVLSQRRPGITAVPEEGGDQSAADRAAAEIWAGILKYDADKLLDMEDLCRRACLDRHTHGQAVAYAYWEDRHHWDKEERRWVGAPQVDLINNRCFGVDPNAETLRDAQYMYLQFERSVEYCLQRWPERKACILAALDAEPTLRDGRPAVGIPGMKSAATEVGTGISKDTKDGRLADLVLKNRLRFSPTTPDNVDWRYAGRTVTVTVVWFRDDAEGEQTDREGYTREELVESGAITIDESGLILVLNPEHEAFLVRDGGGTEPLAQGEELARADWPVRVTKYRGPKFPNGRVVFKINDEILNPDEDEQVWNYRWWPIAVCVHQLLPHMWQGMNSVEMVFGTQDWVNFCSSKILNWLAYFADPEELYEEGTFPDKEERTGLGSRAGKLTRVSTGKLDKVRLLETAALPEGMLRIYELMMRHGQDLTGQHDPARGATSKGQPTATEIATLQQSNQTRMGLQIQLLDAWYQEIMKRVADLRKEHMAEGDTVKLLGERAQAAAVTVLDAGTLELEFDVRLKVSTTLPHDVERRKQDAERLKTLMPQNPEIDRLLLEAFDVPNPDEVLQAGQEYAAFQQWMAAQQAAAEGAPGGPVPPAGPGPEPGPPMV